MTIRSSALQSVMLRTLRRECIASKKREREKEEVGRKKMKFEHCELRKERKGKGKEEEGKLKQSLISKQKKNIRKGRKFS